MRPRLILASWSVLLVLACSPNPAAPANATSFDPTTLATCDQAFRVWVDNAASLNDPEIDLVDILVMQETVQRRVFELCSLAEAERHNQEMLLETAPGMSEPLIEPDFRTFAEVECVDEGPLLSGTSLCAEVGR
jgi:hypothetical protein